MKRILFVDDESHVLDGLKRMLHRQRNEWSMDFVSRGQEALDLLAASEYDVLVTDIRMPEVDGVQLLTEGMRSRPQMVRIVLSGTADQQLALRCVSLAHQFLIKPCNANTLQDTIEKALALRSRLDDPALTGLIGRLRSLPSSPSVYLRLMEALDSDASASQIGAVISQDLSLAARVLQLVNSPLFGHHRVIASPEEATVFIGVQTIRALALSEAVFSQFDANNHPGFSAEELRNHSFHVAVLAREIATVQGFASHVIADVFLGGLMHDIGKLVLGSNFHELYREVVACFDRPEAAREAEHRLFGATHAEVGAYLLWLWGVPGLAAEIVARHHAPIPDSRGKLEPPAAVHLADRIVHGEELPDCWSLAALGLPSGRPVSGSEQVRFASR